MYVAEDNAACLTAVADQAQRGLQNRPSLSIRRRLALGLVLWVLMIAATSVTSVLMLGRIERRLRILSVIDRYTFEVQQARRFEKNFLLYGTNLEDALAQANAAQLILQHEAPNLATVIGSPAVDTMRERVVRYEELLAALQRTVPAGGATPTDVEAELRQEGAQMVREAEELGTRQRQSVNTQLALSRHLASTLLVVMLVVIGLLAVFIARQMLAPLNRIMAATRRIAEGDLTPITARRKYHDEFSELAIAINYMLRELVRRQQLLVQTHKLKAIGTLTAGVAHELNNPINNIMLTAAALQDGYGELSDDERLDLASDLVSESERARDIVRNLLDFAREREVELTPIGVEELIEDTLQLAANQIKLAGVKVQGVLDENLPPLHGDRNQLTQVFLNLVLNALDAMPGGGTLTIAAEESADRRNVLIRFTDTGVGIAEQQLNRIFDPFFTSKKAGRGTGLGLSVSLGIIEQHGGDITLTSEVGVGTTFTVSLPVVEVPALMPELVT